MTVPAPLPTARQVQQAVATVYQRPEYQEHHGIGEWFWEKVGRVLGWIGDQLSRLAGLRETAPVVFWLIVTWLVVSLVALVGHMVWTAVQAARREEDTPAAAKAKAARPRTAADWEAEAARLAAEGKLREAAAALYQALLLRLDALGAIRFDASKTPGDYRIEARQDPRAARALGGFLRLFEPVAFGGRALDAEGWERMKAAAAEGAARG
jgi:uncharacterized protein DUF4129